jgi:alpha-beta hydrolase superfamily lysophospholipase
MENQEGYFPGICGSQIYYQAWLPEGEIKAVLVVVHGLAEHCCRYMNVVEHFVPLGYAVYGLDHYGHGRSEGPRVYVERFDDYIETLKIFVDQVAGWQPGKPLFMVGHSMGGLITPLYLVKYQEGLAGAVISAPGVKVPDTLSPATMTLGRLLSKVAPKAGLTALDPAGVSKDPEVVKAYVDDPLVYNGKITARLAAEMLASMERAVAEADAIMLPVLIVQGGADSMIDPEGAQILHDKIGSEDKTLKVYDGLYHEVFNEPEHPEVLAFVEGWLAAQL